MWRGLTIGARGGDDMTQIMMLKPQTGKMSLVCVEIQMTGLVPGRWKDFTDTIFDWIRSLRLDEPLLSDGLLLEHFDLT